MKVFQLQDDWSIAHLRLAERPRPTPGPGEVLLRMRAASLNYRDLVVVRRGYGHLTGSLPLIPVSDGVGEVVETGPGAEDVSVGERVCPMFMQAWSAGPPSRERLTATLGGPLDGAMAEFMCVPARSVARVPAHLSDEAAATLPCAALTAWNALITEGRLQPGETVLVQGTGGVALFALQFAKLAGARVIVISSSAAKLERARQLGADHLINYREVPEWGKAAKALAGGEGVDHVVELGGSQTLAQSLRAVRTGGTLSLIGVLSGGVVEGIPLGLIVTRQVRLQGITVGSRESFEAMARAMDQHRLEPVVDRVFPFEELPAAMHYLAAGAHVGKVALRHPL